MRRAIVMLLLAACGDESGILVSVTQDPITVPERVQDLEFFVGVDVDADPSTPFVRDANNLDLTADVRDHDLTRTPYKLLLHDGGPDRPSTVIVAVVGRKDGAAIAFGGWTEPQTFMADVVVERHVLLTGAQEGVDFVVTSTGCLSYAGISITSPHDRDCDEDPVTTDCDDADPARASTFEEICGNGIDDDCNDATADDGCAECGSAADCEALYGPAPCGFWECKPAGCELNCPECADADGDGYGTPLVQGGCAGPDCDDGDPAITSDAVGPCYQADPGSLGVGVCRGGTEACVGGVWTGLCSGQVTPSAEACNSQDDDCNGQDDDALGTFSCGVGACANTVPACSGGSVGACFPLSPTTAVDGCAGTPGVDDDCDGAIDEDCAATCVKVALSGNDGLAVMNDNLTPFATIQAAIDWAALDATRPRNVCVASGASCGGGMLAFFPGAVTMANGINLYGGYESTTWSRCGAINVVVQPGTPDGVLFPDTIVDTTIIDGVRVDRAPMSTTAAITIDGAQGAIVSNVVVSNTPTSVTSRGILIKDGAVATIIGSSIDAGSGSVLAVGIHSIQSTPTIIQNCPDLGGGARCADYCGSAPVSAIRGRQTPGPAGSQSYAVVLDDSPGATIAQSSLCAGEADVAALIRIGGDASGTTVRGNFLFMFGGAFESHAIWMDACAGASPWIVDNEQISSVGDSASSSVDAVRAIGDCHPVIDSNVLITGGDEGGTSGAIAIHCGADGTGPSLCTVLGNPNIRGSQFGVPPTAVGVHCEGGACLRIAGNSITGHSGVAAWGVVLDRSGAVVEDNDIVGGCAITSAIGVEAVDSWARLENNRITSGSCNAGSAGSVRFTGVRVLASDGPAEIDLHSNDIDALGATAACTSVGLDLGATSPAPLAPEGLFRNNIIRGGNCPTNFVVAESDVSADPRAFEHNNLDPFSSPIALYFDENTMPITDPTMVPGGVGNISADPMYANFPSDMHILPGSPCVNAGTPIGAPLVDMDNHPRDAMPDIGADEL